MRDAEVATRHDVSPETAINAILGHSGPILLDLDETLYLRNSTEDYIDSARPRLLALLLMRLLDFVKPWRFSGGDVTRDIWRVRLVSLCLPWTDRHWRRRLTGLATAFTNLRLMAVLQAPGAAPIITTTGFRPIVTPLVEALGLPGAQIVAARWSTFADRVDGKLHLVQRALGRDVVRRALVLTDSSQDLKLLDACARPLRAVWPEARHDQALSATYLPGQYLTLIKRPGARYIVRGILQEDFALWVLSSIGLAAVPLMHVMGLFLALLSFWAIYERGYVDNDQVASLYESDPKLSEAFAGSQVATPPWQPWIWAFGCGALAVVAVRWPVMALPMDFGAWAAVLLATHVGFHLYNRFDKGTRVWMFAGLQFARAAAFVALVPIAPIGAAAIGAHVLAKWVPYCVYRIGGKDWPEAPVHLVRLMFFVVLALLLAMSQGFTWLLSGTALALLVWMIYRARQELTHAWRAAKRLDHTDWWETP